MALHSRYENSALERELVSEKSWLRSVTSKLIAKAEGMSDIGKYRLPKNIEWHMTQLEHKKEDL